MADGSMRWCSKIGRKYAGWAIIEFLELVIRMVEEFRMFWRVDSICRTASNLRKSIFGMKKVCRRVALWLVDGW